MKKSFLFLALLAGLALPQLSAQADTSSLRHELGIRLGGINFGGNNTFNLIYKRRAPSGTYTRFSASALDISLSESAPSGTNNISFGLGANIGFERRQAISARFAFCYGMEFGASFSRTNTRTPSFPFSIRFRTATRQATVGAVTGVQYYVGRSFFINMEVVPQLFIRETDSNGQRQLSGGLAFNSLGLMTLGLRF